MSRPKSSPANVVITGPLLEFVEEFRGHLVDVGYTPLSMVNQLRLFGHVSRWLAEKGLGVSDLDERRVEEFLVDRRGAGYTGAISRRALVPLLEVLSGVGVLPAPEPVLLSPVDEVLARFERYLRHERGLADSTIAAYLLRARRFMELETPDGCLGDVTTFQITGAVAADAKVRSVGSAQHFVAALRALLRFGHVEGLVGADFSAAALGVTGRRVMSLPQAVSTGDARAILVGCDRRRATGRRDFAVITTLLRLGLRASEVAVLALDDVDWRAGDVVVRGKGRRTDRLPLPVDVGEAIAGYLQRGRPASPYREVFLSAVAPIGPLGRGAVSSIVRRACRRAGVTPFGAHRLRHTMATEMVQAEVPLSEISQVLRHRNLTSSSIYATVDIDHLRALARPWPGESS